MKWVAQIVAPMSIWRIFMSDNNEIISLLHKAVEDYTASGMYLSRKFHAQYGKIGLQTYGQTHLKQEGVNHVS